MVFVAFIVGAIALLVVPWLEVVLGRNPFVWCVCVTSRSPWLVRHLARASTTAVGRCAPARRLTLSRLSDLHVVLRMPFVVGSRALAGRLGRRLVLFLVDRPDRLWFIGYWLAVLVIIILAQPTSARMGLPNIVVRKVFHAIAIAMFIPAMMLEVR